jgi:hypothetical protein
MDRGMSENVKTKDNLECLEVDGDNIRTTLREIMRKGNDWMHLAQDSVQWRGIFVNTVKYLRVP